MQEKGAQHIQRLLAFSVLWQQVAASAKLVVGKSGRARNRRRFPSVHARVLHLALLPESVAPR